MKEETVREWGKIHPLGSFAFSSVSEATTAQSPTPENLIYQFSPTSFLPETSLARVLPAGLFDPPEYETSAPSKALSLHYGHPRFIEYPDEEIVVTPTRKSLLPILFTVICGFVVWYIYHVTGRQLQLQQEVRHQQESIAQQQQARAGLVASQVRVLSFAEPERSAVTAKLFWDTKKETCQVYLDQLPPTSEGESFHLWYYNRESKFQRAASFQAQNGTAELILRLSPEMLQQVERIIVSLDPAGDSPFPTGPILLRGALQ